MHKNPWKLPLIAVGKWNVKEPKKSFWTRHDLLRDGLIMVGIPTLLGISVWGAFLIYAVIKP